MKKKKRVRVKTVTPVAPNIHEVVLEVESPVPPPELLEAAQFHEPIATTSKKHGFWSWFLGAE